MIKIYHAPPKPMFQFYLQRPCMRSFRKSTVRIVAFKAIFRKAFSDNLLIGCKIVTTVGGKESVPPVSSMRLS